MYRKLWIVFIGLVIALQVTAQEIEVKNHTIDVGQVKFGIPVSVDYELKNTTKRPLLITQVQLGCGCTSADYPHNSIPNDENFAIRITYDSQQMGHLKSIFLYMLMG